MFFPAHTTHLLQLLDGMPVLHYKKMHRKAIQEQAHLGNYFYDKIDFLSNIANICAKSLTKKIIHKGFSDCGIHPFNPDLIPNPLIDKWEAQQQSTLEIWDRDEDNI